MSTNQHVVVIGAGYTGLSAAYELSRAGASVSIVEADQDIGGLAGSFELQPGVRLEKFYHHWFSSDADIIALAKELGVSDCLEYRSSKVGLYYANSQFRLASPFDLLSFTPIPFIDRVRTGLMALKARRISDWSALERISAEEWIVANGGRKAYEVIWRPLLKAKFAAEAEHVSAVWFWNKLKLRGSSRDQKGSEQLLYLRGGFAALADAFREQFRRSAVEIRTGVRVTEILSEGNRVTGVQTTHGCLNADVVLSTIPLPVFLNLTPTLPAEYRHLHSQIRFLGNICLVLRLSRSLSSTYWLNVADPSFPFVGVIEHTNFDALERYNGEHIVYFSRYLPTSDPAYDLGDQAWFEYCLPFIKRLFPEFDESWILGRHVWKAAYSQPVVTKEYSKLIPDFKTPIENLWLSTMAQIYPEDRGTNYAVRQGREVAKQILNQRVEAHVQSNSHA